MYWAGSSCWSRSRSESGGYGGRTRGTTSLRTHTRRQGSSVRAPLQLLYAVQCVLTIIRPPLIPRGELSGLHIDGDFLQPYVYTPSDARDTEHTTHDGTHYSDAPLTSAYASLAYNAPHPPSQDYTPAAPPQTRSKKSEGHSPPRILSAPQLPPSAPVRSGISKKGAATSHPPPYAP